MASDGVAVGRDGSCERMLRGLVVALLVCCQCTASILEMLTSQFGLVQEFGEPIVAALVAGSRPRAQKRFVNSVGRTFCVVVSDNNTLQPAVCDLVMLAEVLRRTSEQLKSRDLNFAIRLQATKIYPLVSFVLNSTHSRQTPAQRNTIYTQQQWLPAQSTHRSNTPPAHKSSTQQPHNPNSQLSSHKPAQKHTCTQMPSSPAPAFNSPQTLVLQAVSPFTTCNASKPDSAERTSCKKRRRS